MNCELRTKRGDVDYFSSVRIATGLRDKASRGAVVTVTAQAGKFILQTATTMVLARLLVPSDFGLMTMVFALTGFVTMFADFGISMATIQRDDLTHGQASGLFWVNLIVGITVMIIIAGMAPFVARFYGRPELLMLTIAYAGLAPITGLSVQHTALLQRRMEFSSIAARDLLSLLAGGAAGIFAAVMGAGYWSLIIRQAVYAIVGMAAVWAGCAWRPGRFAISSDTRPLIGFGGRVAAANFLGYLSNNLDSVVIGWFLGAGPLGIYNRAQNLLMEPLRQVLTPILNVANPSLARLAGDQDRFRKASCELIRKVTLMFAMVAAMLVPLSDWVVRVMLGPGWGEAARVFAVLGLFGFIEPCAFVLGSCLLAAGHAGAFARWRLISVVCLLAGIAAGLPWGMIGVAAGYSVTGIFLRTPMLMWCVARNTCVTMADILKSAMPNIFIGLSVCAILLFVRAHVQFPSAPAGLLVCGSIGIAGYLGLTACFPGTRRALFELCEAGWKPILGIKSRAVSLFQAGDSDVR